MKTICGKDNKSRKRKGCKKCITIFFRRKTNQRMDFRLKSAETDGFDHSAISKCCRGKLKSHKGFIWKFKDYE